MANIIITTISDVAFGIVDSVLNTDNSYNKVCSVRVVGNMISIVNKFNGIEIIKNKSYNDFEVDGQTFTNVDDCRKALDGVVYSFKSSGGGGTGTETDPQFNTWKNLYFDSNGQLKPQYLPAGVSTPTYLLESEPAEKDANSVYIFPTDGVYQSQFWNGSNWVIIGDFDVSSDLTEYITQSQIDAIYAKKTDLEGKLSIVSVDGVTITGDGTNGNPLVSHTSIPTSVDNLLIKNKLEVANSLVIDGSITDVNGDQYPMASQTQLKLTAGDNITIDYTQPRQPIISASGGGSGSNVTYNRSTGELTVDGTQVTVLDLGMGAIKADSITTTSIVEGLGGILAGSFLQNEDGEDYALQKYVDSEDTLIMQEVATNANNLSQHIIGDETRWQQVGDAIAASYAAAIAAMQDMIDGKVLPYDTTQPTQIFGTQGLLNLGGTTTWAVPSSGVIVVTYQALLGVAPVLTINGTAFDYGAGLSLLGSGQPSAPIPVNAGDQIGSTGVLGLGSSYNVSYYPTKL